MSLGLSAPAQPLLTVGQAAEYFASRGWVTSTGTIYTLCATGRIQARRLGAGRGTIRIAKEALDAYLDGTAEQPAGDKPKAPFTPQPLRRVQPKTLKKRGGR